MTSTDDVAGLTPPTPSPVTDQMVERGAEAAYLRNRAGTKDWCDISEEHQEEWRFRARGVLTAALDGMAVVPREPTEAMLDAAYKEPNAYWHHDICEVHDEWRDETKSIYRAMLSAATPPAQGE